jgi:hypothetical protein
MDSQLYRGVYTPFTLGRPLFKKSGKPEYKIDSFADALSRWSTSSELSPSLSLRQPTMCCAVPCFSLAGASGGYDGSGLMRVIGKKKRMSWGSGPGSGYC